ncbi:helix-turn-helix transcriptional regulator [Mycobacterium sp. WMMD1722]|uniref:helix-turn-helix transcriptional regulator n=1 Tax=Mycobacterium sp. WMMD1722 TaxID=3404117 RepID=UPI003BF546F6
MGLSDQPRSAFLVEVVTITSAAGLTDAPVRSHVAITDPDEAAAFLEAAYGVRLRLSIGEPRGDGRALLEHTRISAGAFAVEDIVVDGEIKSAPDALEKVRVLWVERGVVESDCEGMGRRAGAGEIAMTAQHDLPFESHSVDVKVTSVLLDPAMVASVATGLPAEQAPGSVRFARFDPIDGAAAQLWKDTFAFVKDTVLGGDATVSPLLLGQAGRMLAAATLSAFPASAGAEPRPYDRTDHQPVLLRRAVEFIESNAANDIALADIADAVHVSSRAVQYMFRRHLDTTPLQYLRRLRLEHAHQDLKQAYVLHDTVTAIAARWGFAHTGRFAVMYRQTYGRSPHETLRD